MPPKGMRAHLHHINPAGNTPGLNSFPKLQGRLFLRAGIGDVYVLPSSVCLSALDHARRRQLKGREIHFSSQISILILILKFALVLIFLLRESHLSDDGFSD